MEIMYQIVNNVEQRDYIRMYPIWYKPTRLQKFEKQLNVAQFMLRMLNSNK